MDIFLKVCAFNNKCIDNLVTCLDIYKSKYGIERFVLHEFKDKLSILTQYSRSFHSFLAS